MDAEFERGMTEHQRALVREQREQSTPAVGRRMATSDELSPPQSSTNEDDDEGMGFAMD